jgi:outer membrane protein assembly factor BamD
MNPFRTIGLLLCLIGFFCFVLPIDCPAPLIWRPGEGWSYEREGVTTANTPQEQLDLAKKLEAKKDYKNALAGYRRLIRRWPSAASAQEARLGLAECLSGTRYYYKAYKAYQELIQKNPNSPYFDTAIQREFEIANLFLAGEKHKMWPGIVRLPALDKTLEIYEQLVKNGPYSKVGPDSQYRIGLCYEKQKDNLSAVHAFQKVLERYPQNPLAEEAQFQIAWAYKQEAKRAEYDQNAANEAIAAFNDFLIRYPRSDKVQNADKTLADLKFEQSKGLFNIGRFYEKNRAYKSALIYYNAAIEQDPKSEWASQAEKKVAALTPLVNTSVTAP